LVQEDRRDAQVLARSDEVPVLEFALGARQDLLNVREEGEPAPAEELRALPRLFDRPRERLPGVRPARERMQCPLEELDRPCVVPFPDRPLCVTQGDLGFVRVEPFALKPPVEDLRVRDAGRRLAVAVADDLELALDTDGDRVRPLN